MLNDSGILFGLPVTIRGLQAYLDFFPVKRMWPWSVLGVSSNLLLLVGAVIERGGHIAIGLGDYHYPELGFPTNAQLVARVAQLIREMGQQIATPTEVRKMLALE
jgi:uncharacterized protein (DUF849 family)